jgi:hypothetical protein
MEVGPYLMNIGPGSVRFVAGIFQQAAGTIAGTGAKRKLLLFILNLVTLISSGLND